MPGSLPSSIRLGAAGFDAPAGSSPAAALEWAIDEATKLDIQIVASGGDPSIEPSRGRELRARAAELGLEIEPWVRSPFDLVGPHPSEARAALVGSIRASKELGGPVLRTGYGNQRLVRTRFARIPLQEHLDLLHSNLMLAAELAKDEGVTLAIENHTDFTGRQWAEVLERVDSEHIRGAFDTGNGITIFWDPLDDARALAPWAVTTHVKDLRVIENPRPAAGPSPLVPFGLAGCPLGEGDIDMLGILRELVTRSPLGASIPMIVEPSWPAVGIGESLLTKRRELLEANLVNLRALLNRL